MNYLFKAGLGILIGSLFISCFQSCKTSKVQNTKMSRGSFQVYLLMGQSNMAGRGAITSEYVNLQPDRVLMLDKENNWVPAKHPVHFDKPAIAGVGPGLSFGEAMAEAYPNDTIGLVPCAVGGTTISQWRPGAFDEKTQTHPYDDAIRRLREAKKKATIKGVIWLQGESDSKPAPAQLYLGRITTLIERIRKESGDPNLPFVVGELGRFRPQFLMFNKELAKVPKAVPFTLRVTSEGLVHKGDTAHFDSPSMVEYGKRFAKGMLQLQEK